MRILKKNNSIIFAFAMVAFLGSCRKDYYYETPPPHTSQPTITLTAGLVSTAPNSLTSAYWKTADYLKINSQNVSTGYLYGDGMLNMTGTFTGLNAFNNGSDPGLTLKAAYDKDNVYILAEWTDINVNAQFAGWAYNGPADNLKSSESNAGWTSQGNCDRFAMAFDIGNASGAKGTFNTVGCQAACHIVNASTALMHPDAGKVDMWNWNMAHSNPLGYAEDMVANSDSLFPDAGQRMWMRNSKGNDRSGPVFEWNGVDQSVTLPTGKTATLDPKFYLLNKTPFTGDIQKGDSIFHKATQPGECFTCHGDKGQGATETAINSIAEGAKARASILDGMSNNSDMGPYISGLNTTDLNNLIAYIKGLCAGATPGSYLVMPSGSSADIMVVSNVTPSQVSNAASPSLNKHTKYQVLIIRKLKTNNPDDVQFDLATTKTYKFGVALMNNDGKNHIGSIVETLTFK